ncbi:MAG: hypothetical protein GY838_18700 [bacterium]|nr:hypothetical protein [bacterium]
MHRAHPFSRFAPGALLVLLLVAAFVTLPAPLNAYEEGPVVIGPGGGNGGIVIGAEGDPTDSNDYAGNTPDLPDGGDTYHEEVGRTYYATATPAPAPVIRFLGDWSVYLVFDNVRGVTVPSFRFFRVASARGE